MDRECCAHKQLEMKSNAALRENFNFWNKLHSKSTFIRQLLLSSKPEFSYHITPEFGMAAEHVSVSVTSQCKDVPIAVIFIQYIISWALLVSVYFKFIDEELKLLSWTAIISIFPVLLFLSISSSQKDVHVSDCVTLIPGVGLQLSSSGNSPKFFAKEDVVDIILHEVVRNFNVISCVSLRIKSKESKGYEIIPAFPNFQLTFSECERSWSLLHDALNFLH